MIRVLLKIWPALVPVALFLIWYWVALRRARKNPEQDTPQMRDGPWRITLAAALVIAIICLIVEVMLEPATKGTYVPAHMESGQVIEGHIE